MLRSPKAFPLYYENRIPALQPTNENLNQDQSQEWGFAGNSMVCQYFTAMCTETAASLSACRCQIRNLPSSRCRHCIECIQLGSVDTILPRMDPTAEKFDSVGDPHSALNNLLFLHITSWTTICPNSPSNFWLTGTLLAYFQFQPNQKHY